METDNIRQCIEFVERYCSWAMTEGMYNQHFKLMVVEAKEELKKLTDQS